MLSSIYDSATDTTRLTVNGQLYEGAAGGVVRKTFDLSATLGPLGLGIEDGVAWLSANVSVGVAGKLTFGSLYRGHQRFAAWIPETRRGRRIRIDSPNRPAGRIGRV